MASRYKVNQQTNQIIINDTLKDRFEKPYGKWDKDDNGHNRLQKTYGEFLRAVVWESNDIAEGWDENDIEVVIEQLIKDKKKLFGAVQYMHNMAKKEFV